MYTATQENPGLAKKVSAQDRDGSQPLLVKGMDVFTKIKHEQSNLIADIRAKLRSIRARSDRENAISDKRPEPIDFVGSFEEQLRELSFNTDELKDIYHHICEIV